MRNITRLYFLFRNFNLSNNTFCILFFFVMTTPKKSIKKGPLDESEDRDMINDDSRNKKSFDDDDDDFDMPLDDLDAFDDFGDDEDDY